MPHLGPIHQPSRLLKLDGFLDKDWDLEKTVNSGSDFEESGVSDFQRDLRVDFTFFAPSKRKTNQ